MSDHLKSLLKSIQDYPTKLVWTLRVSSKSGPCDERSMWRRDPGTQQEATLQPMVGIWPHCAIGHYSEPHEGKKTGTPQATEILQHQHSSATIKDSGKEKGVWGFCCCCCCFLIWTCSHLYSGLSSSVYVSVCCVIEKKRLNCETPQPFRV